MKNKETNNQRIAALEEKVTEQAKTIEELQQQLQALSTVFTNVNILFANAAHHLAVSPSKSNEDSQNSSEKIDVEECKVNEKKKESSIPPLQYNYKNLLQEHCVKQGWNFPTYETNRCPGGFRSEVNLNDENCTSDIMKSKVLAEKSGACLLLKQLNVIDSNGIPISEGESGRVSSTGVSKYSWCKNQLQEYFAKYGLTYPIYNILPVQGPGKGFTAEVSHDKYPEKVMGPVGCSKRIAEQMAAHKAISVWKILDLGG